MNQISLHTLACEGRLTHGLKNSSNPLLLLLLGKIICLMPQSHMIWPNIMFFLHFQTIIMQFQRFSRKLPLHYFNSEIVILYSIPPIRNGNATSNLFCNEFCLFFRKIKNSLASYYYIKSRFGLF